MKRRIGKVKKIILLTASYLVGKLMRSVEVEKQVMSLTVVTSLMAATEIMWLVILPAVELN